jgi:hypothetical protein
MWVRKPDGGADLDPDFPSKAIRIKAFSESNIYIKNIQLYQIFQFLFKSIHLTADIQQKMLSSEEPYNFREKKLPPKHPFLEIRKKVEDIYAALVTIYWVVPGWSSG